MPAGRLQAPLESTPESNVAAAQAFQANIDRAKASLEPVDFPWYSYHILGGVTFIDALCAQSGLTLDEMAAAKPLLDIGCADGHLSFFLESLGYQTTAVDHAPTSANDMKGVRALKQALGSAVEIIDTDLDRGFAPPRSDYGLVVLLGILYHLKNPFLMLETLAEVADYCVLSTRVARRAPDGTSFHDLPMAYLLGPDEANGDPSNFWIFSEAGLRRLIERAGWDIRALVHSGNTRNSDPATAAGDERVYCLLSRTSLFTNGKMLSGWHAAEGPRNGWRWSEPEFQAEFFIGPESKREIDMQLYLSEARDVTLNASCGGRVLATALFREPGVHQWRFALPGRAGERIVLAFAVAGVASGAASDTRALGVIINRLHLR